MQPEQVATSCRKVLFFSLSLFISSSRLEWQSFLRMLESALPSKSSSKRFILFSISLSLSLSFCSFSTFILHPSTARPVAKLHSQCGFTGLGITNDLNKWRKFGRAKASKERANSMWSHPLQTVH